MLGISYNVSDHVLEVFQMLCLINRIFKFLNTSSHKKESFLAFEVLIISYSLYSESKTSNNLIIRY